MNIKGPRVPLVSILIPVIRTDWLNEAIGSAVNQTFKDVEIIVSDDTAGDKVETLVSRWDDPRIKYVKNPQQGKMGTNRDFIISQAQGEYIKHLFDDDFLYPHSIEMLLDMLRETKCKLAFHSRNVVDLNSNVIGQPRFRMKTQHESFVDRFSRKIKNKISRYFSSKESDYNKNDFCYISSQYFFDYMIARMSNHIGEPTNIIFHAPTFHDMRDKYTIVGTQMRFLTDVALYTNFVMQAGLFNALD